MISKTQEKLIRSLHAQKGRTKTGLCLAEGKKVIKTAENFIEYTFSPDDSTNFKKLVTTQTPQSLAAIARIPQWNMDKVMQSPTLVVLDGIQDPGNLGSIFRLCLGFKASLVLVESADPSNPKVIRSSAGAFFQVPWIKMSKKQIGEFAQSTDAEIYRLESPKHGRRIHLEFTPSLNLPEKIMLIAGSEGSGISLDIQGTSLSIPHEKKLESLNVAHAIAIILFFRHI